MRPACVIFKERTHNGEFFGNSEAAKPPRRVTHHPDRGWVGCQPMTAVNALGA